MKKGDAGPEFTTLDVERIVACLPDAIDGRRRELLPLILRDWSCTDLRKHFSREPREIIRNRIKQLKAVGNRAAQLLPAMEAVDERGRIRIAIFIALADGEGHALFELYDELAVLTRRLDEERAFLTSLAAAAPKAGGKARRGRPRNTLAYLVMLDAAAIFEWLTEKRAARGVHRSYGCETGPFWRFVAALWPVVFGKGGHGLTAAVKNWDAARRRHKEESGLIANIAARHPTWGIFGG